MGAPEPAGIDFCTYMAQALTGAAPNAEPSMAEKAERCERIAAMLRSFNDPAADWAAAGFEAWLSKGGELGRHLGLQSSVPRAYNTPQKAVQKARRDLMIRELADGELLSTSPNRAKTLADMARNGHPLVLRIAEATELKVPTSPAQFKRILRDS